MSRLFGEVWFLRWGTSPKVIARLIVMEKFPALKSQLLQKVMWGGGMRKGRCSGKGVTGGYGVGDGVCRGITGKR